MHAERPTFTSFAEFYPFYLAEHSNRTCRKLHFTGTLLAILFLLHGVMYRSHYSMLMIPVAGYGFAWAGHFFFEKNQPATFTHPVYSLMGDFLMFGQLLTGRLGF